MRQAVCHATPLGMMYVKSVRALAVQSSQCLLVDQQSGKCHSHQEQGSLSPTVCTPSTCAVDKLVTHNSSRKWVNH